MNKKLIRLTEQDLHRIVRKSINMILKEANVVAGTNTLKKTTFNDDNRGRKHNMTVDYSSSENRTAPDFVQMWADRLEKALNAKGDVFAVNGYVDNKAEYHQYHGKKNATYIVLSVEPSDYDWDLFGNSYLKKLSDFAKTTIEKHFSNLLRRGDMFMAITDTDDYFPIKLIISPYEDESNFLKNNKPRQIPSGNSKYKGAKSFDDDGL